MAGYKIDTGVPFLADDDGVVVGYVDNKGVERSLDGSLLNRDTLNPVPALAALEEQVGKTSGPDGFYSADGDSVPPTILDSGHALLYSGAAQPVIDSGGISITAGTGQRALYIEAQLDENVTRMGAEFMFSGVSDTGAIALIPWKTPNQYPLIPSTGAHFVLSQYEFFIESFDPLLINTVRYAQKTFNKKLATNTWYKIEWFIENDNISVLLPDGSVVYYTSQKLIDNAGPYACWEIFQNNGATDCRGVFRNIWAASKNNKFIRPILSPEQVDERLKIKTVDTITVIADSAIPTSNAVVSIDLVVPMVAGQMRKNHVTASGYVNAVPAGQSYIMGLSIKNSLGVEVSAPVFFAAVGPYTGRVTCESLIDMTFGDGTTVALTHFCTAAGATANVAAASPWVLSATPV